MKTNTFLQPHGESIASPKQHNPDNLTPEQVGEGWRLLDEDEILDDAIPALSSTHRWEPTATEWVAGWAGTNKRFTYRTRLPRAELRAARGLSPESPGADGELTGDKPFPKPLFSCSVPGCAEEHSFLAEDLFWCARNGKWVCENCWCNNAHGDRGETLAEALKRKDEAQRIEILREFADVKCELVETLRNALEQVSGSTIGKKRIVDASLEAAK